mgnify:CR=1 FL=1
MDKTDWQGLDGEPEDQRMNRIHDLINAAEKPIDDNICMALEFMFYEIDKLRNERDGLQARSLDTPARVG